MHMPSTFNQSRSIYCLWKIRRQRIAKALSPEQQDQGSYKLSVCMHFHERVRVISHADMAFSMCPCSATTCSYPACANGSNLCPLGGGDFTIKISKGHSRLTKSRHLIEWSQWTQQRSVSSFVRLQLSGGWVLERVWILQNCSRMCFRLVFTFKTELGHFWLIYYLFHGYF